MFIFLFSSVYFLFLLLFSTVQIASHVDVGSLKQNSIDIVRVEMWSLNDESDWLGLDELEELLGSVKDLQTASAVELVKPDLHVWPIILKYIWLNEEKSFFIINSDCPNMIQKAFIRMARATLRPRFAFS